MKVFRTTSLDVFTECRLWFGTSEIEVLIDRRKLKFLTKCTQSSNELLQIFAGLRTLSLAFTWHVLTECNWN